MPGQTVGLRVSPFHLTQSFQVVLQWEYNFVHASIAMSSSKTKFSNPCPNRSSNRKNPCVPAPYPRIMRSCNGSGASENRYLATSILRAAELKFVTGIRKLYMSFGLRFRLYLQQRGDHSIHLERVKADRFRGVSMFCGVGFFAGWICWVEPIQISSGIESAIEQTRIMGSIDRDIVAPDVLVKPLANSSDSAALQVIAQ